MFALVLGLGCAQQGQGVAVAHSSVASPAVSPRAYLERRAALEQVRRELAALPREEARARAEVALADGVTDLVEAWLGTPWDFYGTAPAPGDDPIACGHFVAGVLDDAGLEVQRLELGQQASERIVQTVTGPASVRRFRRRPVADVVAQVQDDGDGVYVVGLDWHAGMLVVDEGLVRFCHASWYAGVVCEDARSSPALPSGYTVVGRLGDDGLIDAWLDGTALPTAGRAPVTTRTGG